MASDTKIRSWCAIINYELIIRNGISAVDNEISQNSLEITVKERIILMRAVRRLIDKQLMAALARKAKVMMEGMDAAITDEVNTVSLILKEAKITGLANDVLCRLIKTHVEEAVKEEFYL